MIHKKYIESSSLEIGKVFLGYEVMSATNNSLVLRKLT